MQDSDNTWAHNYVMRNFVDGRMVEREPVRRVPPAMAESIKLALDRIDTATAARDQAKREAKELIDSLQPLVDRFGEFELTFQSKFQQYRTRLSLQKKEEALRVVEAAFIDSRGEDRQWMVQETLQKLTEQLQKKC